MSWDFDIVIHIGFPKTGTHFFNEAFLPALPGIHYVPRERTRTALARVWKVPEGEDLPSGVGETVRSEIAPLLEPGKVNVLSDVHFVNRGAPALPWASDLGFLARRLRDVLGPCKVVMVLRNPLTWIKSYYLEDLRPEGQKTIAFMDLNAWVEQAFDRRPNSPVQILKYREIIESYASVFGQKNVGVLLIEENVKAPEMFQDRFCRFAGVATPVDLVVPPGKKVYTSISARQLAVMKVLSRFGLDGNYTQLRHLVPPALRRVLTRWLGGGRKPQQELAQELDQRLAEFVSDDMFWLQETLDLPVAEYGYPLLRT